MKKILFAALMSVLFVSCKKEATPSPTVSVEMVSNEISLFKNLTGENERILFKIRFRITPNQTLYFSPVPTLRGPIQTVGSPQRPASGYQIVLDRSGDVVETFNSLSIWPVANTAIIGPSYVLLANQAHDFVVELELKNPATGNYRLSIPIVALYRDPGFKYLCWMNSTEDIKTDYFFVP